MAQPALVIECSDMMARILDALVDTGCFGPTRDAAAQRMLELKLFEMSVALWQVKK